MEYTASHKNSFKWSFKDDVLHYDTPQILASIQQPASIWNCFFKIKNTSLKNFHCNANLEITIPSTVLNKIFYIFQIFCSIILVRTKCLKKKNSQVKVLRNVWILPSQNPLVIDFFCQSNFALK